jgi:hypothetical protein
MLKSGDLAGHARKSDGRVCICIDGIDFLRSRIAWALMMGEWPTVEIDHKDTDPKNDKWSNLRLSTRSQNVANTNIGKRNTSGYKGVSFDPWTKRWRVRVAKKTIGRFNSKDDAVLAYKLEALKVFGEFARSAP